MNRLRIVHKDIRVTRAAGRAARLRPAFIPFVYRRAGGPVIHQRNESRTNIIMSLRAELHALARATDSGARGDIPARLLAGEQVIRRGEIVERVGRRGSRVESAPALPERRVEAVARAGAHVAPRAPMVYIRPPAPAPALVTTPPVAEVTARLPKLAARAEQSGFSPIDINRLTDQVVTAIDRRISAHRERLGRR